MTTFKVDFSEGVERRLLPKGWYRIAVETVKPGVSSGGNPMATAMLRVVEGPSEGQPLFMNWPLTGKGAGITKAAVRALLGDEAANNQVEFDCEAFVGCQANAFVVQKVWAEEDQGDGELRNNISRLKAIEYTGDEGEVAKLFA